MARSYSDEDGSEGGRREAYLVMVAEEAPPPPPEVRVVACCCSEKSGGVGMCRVREERGKYSGQGRPPPREMRPGVLRCLAACLREQGRRRRDSCVRWSVLEGQLGVYVGEGWKGDRESYGPSVWLWVFLWSG